MSKVVIFLESAFEYLDKYVEFFQLFYEEMFTDTGIWSESTMVDEYIEKSLYLRKVVLSVTREKMERDLLPYELLPSGMKKSVLTVEQRRLEIIYEESETEWIIHEIHIKHR